MKKISLIAIGLALAAPTYLQAAGGVAGSVHDMSLTTYSTNIVGGVTNVSSHYSWNTRKGLCSPCHAAHHTDEDQIAPLWVHGTSTASFVPYDSPSLNAVVGAPSGNSLACLSCHDGTVALNQGINGQIGSSSAALEYIDAGAVIGPDLHTTHPISFTYDSGLATADGGLEDPTSYKIGDPKTKLTVQTAPAPTTWTGTSLAGKTIDEALLIGGKMECSSCHDVHKLEGSSATSGILLRISGNDADGRGSAICRTCHIK